MAIKSNGPRLAYSVSECAEELGVSPPTIFRMIRSGELTCAVRIGKRRLVIPKILLDDWLREKATKGVPQ